MNVRVKLFRHMDSQPKGSGSNHVKVKPLTFSTSTLYFTKVILTIHATYKKI